MNLEQMRARLAAIVAELKKFEGVENFSDEEVTKIDALSAEFETLKKQIEAKEKIEATAQQAQASAGRKVTPTSVEVVAPSALEKNGGFKNMGDFALAVKASASGQIDRRFKNTMFERSGEEGGFLVPEEMMTSITKKIASDDSLLARTRQFRVSGNNLSLPTDELAPWTGGIQAYWTAEGGTITDSKFKLGQASWKLNKLAAMVKVTDELLEDAVALESYMMAMAPEAINYKLNSAIISGDGVGKPTGILNSGFKITAAKESAQTADTIVAKNVIKMYSKMLPQSRANAVWFINAGCEEQLRLMKDDLGNFIYLAPGSQLNQTPYGLLLGRPVIPLLSAMPALGDEGDIIFADLNYYYSLLKSQGIKQSVSAHLYFAQDIQAYKWTLRVDGSCPFKTPVTTEFGAHQMSAFVTLEAR